MRRFAPPLGARDPTDRATPYPTSVLGGKVGGQATPCAKALCVFFFLGGVVADGGVPEADPDAPNPGQANRRQGRVGGVPPTRPKGELPRGRKRERDSARPHGLPNRAKRRCATSAHNRRGEAPQAHETDQPSRRGAKPRVGTQDKENPTTEGSRTVANNEARRQAYEAHKRARDAWLEAAEWDERYQDGETEDYDEGVDLGSEARGASETAAEKDPDWRGLDDVLEVGSAWDAYSLHEDRVRELAAT